MSVYYRLLIKKVLYKIKPMYFKNRFLHFALGLLLIGCFSTCAKETKSDVVVYENDFESGNLMDITSGKIASFNSTKVLGRYNNSGFKLALTGLPAHTLVEISFDLYILDSWDGNKLGVDGPDIWNMKVDGKDYIYTTFSNGNCGGGFCLPQSYPNAYKNSDNNPATGAFNKSLKGACHFSTMVGGASMYKITKRIQHNGSNLTLECLDQLIQTNVIDPLCDESWAVDNIKIRAINL